ncbi:MAG: glutamate 5-kinase [Lachnospiraceae bacterium]|jgi:glutamate 5-kinase
MDNRARLKSKSRIVIKIGSSSLFHSETGQLDYLRIEQLVRIIVDITGDGKDVILVSSGAISTGRNIMGLALSDGTIPVRQACAAVGQAKLITVYQRMFAQYGKTAAQILLTRYTIHSELTRTNAANTFKELIKMKVVPIVNENDTVTTEEIEFGDNDCLSAMVSILADADLLIILSDIDGLYDDNPKTNPNATFIPYVDDLNEEIVSMGRKTPGTGYGTGGMVSKLEAARIATDAGIDMVITNAGDLNNIYKVLNGENIGTLFNASDNRVFHFEEFDIKD